MEIAAQSADNPALSVSVIVPTYNSASTLGDCLDSIKNQDYRGEVEIIIADGGIIAIKKTLLQPGCIE